MDTENKPQTQNQICTIRIMFPMSSDEQAIDCKKKIGVVLADIPDARIEFTLTNLPVGGNKGIS